jgi:hypothetical protein
MTGRHHTPHPHPRQRVVDKLDLVGCGYIDRDTVSARCPLCGGVLAVTFTDIAVRFRCCTADCTEEQIARAVFDREPETDDMVAAHLNRLTDLLQIGVTPDILSEAA